MAISAPRRLRQNWSLRDVSTVGGQDQKGNARLEVFAASLKQSLDSLATSAFSRFAVPNAHEQANSEKGNLTYQVARYGPTLQSALTTQERRPHRFPDNAPCFLAWCVQEVAERRECSWFFGISAKPLFA